MIKLGLMWIQKKIEIFFISILIAIIRFIAPLILMVGLSGCATEKKHDYIAPSPVAVVSSVSSARTAATSLGGYVAPGGERAYAELTNSLNEAQISVGQYVSQVNEQSRQLDAAQNEAVYWRMKQQKALAELLWWRGIALASILAVVGYIGIKTAWRFTF